MSSVFSTLATAIGSMAPTIATMLGGPLAGVAVSSLEGALGLRNSANPADGAQSITNALQSAALTPEQIAAVRAADQRHAEVMGQQGIDLEKINAAHAEAFAHIDEEDRDSARKREETVKDSTPRNLAYLVILGSGAMFAFTLAGMTKVDSALAGTLIGYLVSEMKQVLSYYFGTSASSARKDDALASSVPVSAVATIKG